MTDLKQAAMQQALEALEGELWKMLDKPVDEQYRVRYAYLLRVITALREALAQPPLPVQKPVACRFCHDKKGCWAWQCYKCGEIDDVQKPSPLPVQPVQEPLQYSFKAHWTDDKRIGVVACVTRPDGGVHLLQTIIDSPSEQRQPLTDEQIKVIHFDLCNTVGSDYKTVARAIEAAHGIKEQP